MRTLKLSWKTPAFASSAAGIQKLASQPRSLQVGVVSSYFNSLEAHLCVKGQNSLKGSLHARRRASALWLGWGALSSVSVTLWFEAGHRVYPSPLPPRWHNLVAVPRSHAKAPCVPPGGCFAVSDSVWGYLRRTHIRLEGANCCQETFPWRFPADIVKAGWGEQAGVTVGCAVRKGGLSKAGFVKIRLF